jgi:hypothetical protein
MLGALETEKFDVFPGSCLVGSEDGLANGDSDVEMLENLNTSEDLAGYEAALISLEKLA